MVKEVTLIINPKSGAFSKRGVGDSLVSELVKVGFAPRVVYTLMAGHAQALAREAAEHGDYAVLACGGDGTVNEVAAGLIGSDTALGIIPTGSGNGLARHIGIPMDMQGAIQTIGECNVVKCDYGTVNGRPFFCTFGVGFDAAVSRRFAEKPKRGVQSYIDSVVEEFMNYTSDCYEVTFDNCKIVDKALMVAVCNASQYGNNAFIAPSASITDGQLDVTIISNGLPIENAWTGVAIMAGTIGNRGKFRTYRTNRLTIRRFQSGMTHIDGEPTELGTTLEIECHAGGLKVLTPTKQKKFIPVITPALLGIKEWDAFVRRVFHKRK